MKKELAEAGFCELKEQEAWHLAAGGAYYVTRNNSSVIAFRVPQSGCCTGYQILSSHSDSPVFKVKENPHVEAEGTYVKLNVEKYGWMILSTWMDRPLSVAGRIAVRSGEGRLESKLVHIDRDLLMIPHLAPHLNPEIHNGYKYDLKTDLFPVLGALPAAGSGSAKPSLTALLAAEAGVDEADIVATDVYLYNRQKGTLWGSENEFLACTKLDDVECAYGSFRGILEA
jgi:aspartyl aminopeptidase